MEGGFPGNGAGVRDVDRALVYSAEDQWSAAIDRGGPIDFFGSRLQLPVQLRFGDFAAAQAYLDRLVSSYPRTPTVALRTRRGAARAHSSQGVIAIPMQAPWACRESVLLHEFAHHLKATDSMSPGDGGADPSGQAAHGATFRGIMVRLAGDMQAPESGLLLRSCYESNGLAVPVYVD